MGKPRNTKIAILPSTTRKGTILNTSAALDSPSVIDKLVSPPHASNAGTSAESENSHNIDNVSAVLDDSGSLGSFLDATIARSRQIENTETPNATTPVNSPELDYFSDDPDEDYVELNDDFIEKCNATNDARKIKKLLAEHAVRYKLSPDPKFATSPINIRDKDYDFSLDLSHIAIVEKTPFCGTEKESAVEHMTELSTLSSLFSDDVKMRTYFVAKIFPFSLKDDAKTWYNNLPPNSIRSPKELLDVFFRKYFPASAQHIALQRIYNFDQGDEEKLPEAWARFCSLIRARPDHDLEKHDLLDIFYSGLTIESRAYLDSCAGCVFRKRTPDDAEELLAKISRNHDDWTTPEPTPTPILKKRGLIKLNDEDMREAKKSLKEKGIKSEDVKNLPPIEDICEIIPPSSMIEDPLYPEGHPKRIEQDSQHIEPSAHSRKKKKKKHKNVVESSEPVNDPNSISISDAETESGNEHDNDNNDTPDKEEVEEEPEKHAKNKKYTKEDFIAEKHEKHAYEVTTRGGVSTQDPLYPEGHPKRIEQDSQRIEPSAPSKKKKKKHKTVVESSEPVNDPNSISISDAETESGNEHDNGNDKNDASDKEEVEEEPEKHAKNKKYTKEDFIAKKHGNEREPWVQKQMPFPAKKLKSKEEEHYNKFCDWMKPLFLQIPLTDAIKLPPYSKYMKDIVTNKRKIPNEEISTMLANYSFNGKVPKKLGDPDKLIPTDISLQMADKSTAIPVGICEDVPVQVTKKGRDDMDIRACDNKIVNQENKNSADIITWREYEALRNEMRREFRTKDDELKGTVDEIKQTLDATNVTVTGLADQMTDIQRNIADMRLAIENLTAQQQQQDDDEDPELEDDAHNARGAPRGHRPRGWVPLGRNGRGQDEEDGLGKPKFSIPKFEGGADVEEYLTWELKIEKLWSLHPNYSEDKKIKLASSEFDGYALRWWDSLQAGEIDNLTVSLGQSTLVVLCRFHVGAGIPGVAPHYIPPPSTFNVLLDSYWSD
ncbi:hypothetical protein QYE76_056184 [Lolium multiflorum]|uniref:Retrotransposon gag domain-containing protein n=1 Tax=Lolium multiflorum TaxID=4521 RepID=A0AAD8T2I0_LOLMU|nr:hypothetical protein QYE76_056184 [Lolium multiflorum]